MVVKAVGISGKPTLHVGGEHEAVILAAPGEESVSGHDCVQEVPKPATCGCDDAQVNGILFSTTPPLVLGSEVLPMMSRRVATTVSDEESPFAVRKEVCPLAAVFISSAMFWMGQVEKKSRAGEVWFCELAYCGC